jgi:Xaa-Pro aminopeptidase
MAHLFTDSAVVERMSGLSLKGTMTMPTQNHDRRHVLPAVLSTNSDEFFLVRHQDGDNVAACGFNRMPVVTFSPYWLPKPADPMPRTLAEAVLSRLKGEPLTIDGATPASVYEELQATIPVEVEREPPSPVDAYRIRRQDILAKFNHHRSEVAEVARRLTHSHPQAQQLSRWLANQPDSRFDLLEKMAAGQGISAFLASWFTDFQELSGLRGSFAENDGCASLFLLGTDEIWIIAPIGTDLGLVGNARRYSSLAQAVQDLAGQRLVGFEQDTLGASRLLDLRDHGVRMKDGGMLLRDWREEKASYDVPYYVVGALASRYAMEGALHFAGQAIRSGVEITERDVDRVYRHLIQEFEVQHRLPVRLQFYFGSNHAGSRTILPSRPTDYPLSAGSTTVKIDAGIFVVDDGLLHACTDIARTVTTTRAATEVFEAMEHAVVREIIPKIRSGMSGECIHEVAVNTMAEHESVFRAHGYMPDDFSWRTGYVRDVGHVLDRQESYTYPFRPGTKRQLNPGMIACVEIHCPYNGHNMTIEDTFVADESGAIIISRTPDEFGPDAKIAYFPRR